MFDKSIAENLGKTLENIISYFKRYEKNRKNSPEFFLNM